MIQHEEYKALGRTKKVRKESYRHLFDSEMGIVLVLLLEIIIIVSEFYILFKYLKIKYSKIHSRKKEPSFG